MGDKLEKPTRNNFSIEKAHQVLTAGVIAVLLFAVGIPFYVIFFLGAFTFFLWKIFAHGSGGEVRSIFGFYLRASEILREDNRRWYGFEVQEAIERGRKIMNTSNSSPPLVKFALAALYRKAGDDSSALRLLEELYESGEDREAEIMYPSPTLKEYVRILRKIERSPQEAPLTAAAVRSLERLRRTKGNDLLTELRMAGNSNDKRVRSLADAEQDTSDEPLARDLSESNSERRTLFGREDSFDPDADAEGDAERRKPMPEERQSISELLRDIYDDTAG